jgi:hypothetical protein
MNNKDNMGALNKRAKKDSTNKQVIILLVVILLVILGIFLVLKSVGNTEKKVDSANIETIMKNGETKLIFVMSSDKSKAGKSNDIKKYLDDKKINYVTYDVSKYSKKDYQKMLQDLSINPSDFGYPAVIYIKDGKLYSNIINLDDTKVVDTFIKDYDLTKVK